MVRKHLIALLIVGGVLFAAAGFAQQTASGIDTSDPEGGQVCVCASEEGTDIDGCWGDLACAGAVQCQSSADCAANETCWRGDNCCGVPICAITCTGDEACPGPAGTCGTYELCLAGVPTMGQWGLVTLAGMVGLIALFVLWRRSRFSAMASFVLLAFALSLGAYSIGSVRDTLASCQPTPDGELAAALFLDE